jgi:hypothetical protein
MRKSFKHYKRNKKNKSKRRRTRQKILKAGENDNVTCCMCEKIINKDDAFIPRECLNKYGKAAHRICKNCWWNEFALEGVSHKCPGCVKGLPLTYVKKEPPVVVDLTED